MPRTYGYSPFAYPPGVRTPELVEEATPVEIINPHYKPATNSTTEEAVDKVTQSDITRCNIAQPLLVMNPYVSARLAEASIASAQLGR